MNPPPRRVTPIAFERPGQIPGLDGCTGIAGVGICIQCDRLYQAGHQIKPKAARPPGGVYFCVDQVIDGVHVTSVPRDQGGDKSQRCGGDGIASPVNEGVQA